MHLIADLLAIALLAAIPAFIIIHAWIRIADRINPPVDDDYDPPMRR